MLSGNTNCHSFPLECPGEEAPSSGLRLSKLGRLNTVEQTQEKLYSLFKCM